MGRIWWLCTLLSVFLAVSASGQSQRRLGILVGFSAGLGQSSTSTVQPIRDGWQNDFVPSGGSMTLSVREPGDLELRIEVAPIFRITQKIEIGLPVFFDVASLSSDHSVVARQVVDWWDPVPLTELRLEEGLGIGLLMRFSRLEFSYALQAYEILLDQFVGVNRFGSRNTARRISTTRIDDDIGFTADVTVLLSRLEGHRRTFGIGIYHKAFGDVTITGISFRFRRSVF